MPLWQINTAKGVYTPEDKKVFAENITNFYREVAGLPRFYTSVVFQEWDRENFIVGGEPTDDFVMIGITHVARNMDELSEKLGTTVTTEALFESMRDSFAAIIKPFTNDRGLRWESAVMEGLFESWMIDGMKPPPPWSEAEKKWARDNRPSPYDESVSTAS